MIKVLCVDGDPEGRDRIAQAVTAAGAEPLPVGSCQQALRLAQIAQLVVAAGEEGLHTLERLAFERPALIRIAVVDASSVERLLDVIERVHPWTLIPQPFKPARLASAVGDALGEAHIERSRGDATRPFVRPLPSEPPAFIRLVIDRLTGTYASHYLQLRLQDEVERSLRFRRPMCMALIDIDDLRGVNDRLGWAAGDTVLKQVGGVIVAGAREVDLVGRWAGGAFALILPETTAGAAYAIAERLRADVAGRRVLLRPGDAKSGAQITVSCGVAPMLVEGALQGESVVMRADRALWRAKSTGRNRSVADE